MKKLSVLFILALLVTLVASACATGGESTRQRGQTQTTEQRVEEEPAAEDEVEDEEIEDEEMAEDQDEMQEGMMARCPVAVEGTEVMAEPTEQGAAMHFTTTGDVDELRSRVQWMADHHNQMMGGEDAGEMPRGMQQRRKRMQRGEHGRMHGQKMKKGKRRGMKRGSGGMMRMPEAEARYEEAEDGARLVFTAEDPDDATQVQQHITQHVERVQEGTCPMMYMKGADEDSEADEADVDEADDES
ncbi:MAG: hypothetical protein ACOC9J_03415 [Persicimonas sp.]